jgi:hypothetical protein
MKNCKTIYDSIIKNNKLPVVENEQGYIEFIPDSKNIQCMLIGSPANTTFIVCDKFYYDSYLSEYENLELLIEQCESSINILNTIPAYEDIL